MKEKFVKFWRSYAGEYSGMTPVAAYVDRLIQNPLKQT